nr:ethanolamine utilization protein EutH [Clostridiales bacterium]
MSVGDIITYVMLFFALIGAADRAIGCRFGPGKAFEKGLEASGALILAMVGPVALAPMIAAYLAPLVTPFFRSVGIDPSIIAGLLMANDSGGWPLALALADDAAVGRLTGSVMGSTMGCAIMFSIPMTFILTPENKRPAAAKGLAIGLTTIPAVNLISGLMFGIPLIRLLLNLLPLILFAGLFIIGLLLFEPFTVKAVTVLGYIMTAVLTIALAAAMVVKVLGLKIENFGSFDDAMLIIGSIVIFLSGAFTIL